MSRMSERLRGHPKTHNNPAAKAAKIEIRRNVLDAVGRDAHVFDAFAGKGEMFKAVWHEAAGYVGCDLNWHPDERLAYVADNLRVMRCIDLQKFRIFDLDAFGSPYDQAVVLAARRFVQPDELVGLILTDGSAIKLKMGGAPNSMQLLAGLTASPAGLNRWQDELIDRAIASLAKRMRCKVERRWQATMTKGAAMRYIGLVLRGLPLD
jgi:hypothetical protein